MDGGGRELMRGRCGVRCLAGALGAVAVVVLASCWKAPGTPGWELDSALSEKLPSASAVQHILPEDEFATTSEFPVDGAKDERVQARQRRVGARNVWAWSTDEQRRARPLAPDLAIELLLYESDSEASAAALWEEQPPEHAHASSSVNTDGLTPAEIDERSPLWSAPVPEGDRTFRWHSVCLASPYPQRRAVVCDGLHAWVQFCRWNMEVVVAKTGLPIDEAWVTALLASAAHETAGELACR